METNRGKEKDGEVTRSNPKWKEEGKDRHGSLALPYVLFAHSFQLAHTSSFLSTRTDVGMGPKPKEIDRDQKRKRHRERKREVDMKPPE